MVDYNKFVSLMEPITLWNKEYLVFCEGVKLLTGASPNMVIGERLHDDYCNLAAEVAGIDVECIYWYLYERKPHDVQTLEEFYNVLKEEDVSE